MIGEANMIPWNSEEMKSRDDWKRISTWQFPDGWYHLHSRYLKGDMIWVLSSRASPICKLEGRCRIVSISTIVRNEILGD